MDLIVCRNVLIYFEGEAQNRVLSNFYFSLKRGGHLFLGPSESLGELTRGFDTVDHHHRLFQRSATVDLPRMDSPLSPVFRVGVKDSLPLVNRPKGTDESQVINLAYDALLSRFLPASIVITDSFELLHCFGDARELLQIPTGKVTLNVCRLLPPDLASAVSLIITQQMQTASESVLGPIPVLLRDDKRHCDLRAFACEKNGRRYYIITFEMLRYAQSVSEDSPEENAEGGLHWRTQVFELEKRLAYTQQSLQSTVEELETSNEELQSTNEELTAANEELQSTNE